MKKILLVTLLGLLTTSGSYAQCTFEKLFPLPWKASKYSINETYQSDPLYMPSADTIRGSAFQHGLDYFFTARNMQLGFLSYQNKEEHPCFGPGTVILNCVANDSGLVAYNYQVTYSIEEHEVYKAVLDQIRQMMEKKFTYNSVVKNPTAAVDAQGNQLKGEGVSVYFNDEPIVHTNLTYPQFVVRAGYLAKPPKTGDGKIAMNQAEEIQYYRIEILYKMQLPKW